MFIGHYAVAFALKKAEPRISLGTLFLSVQWLDLLWPVFLLLGIEHVRIDPGNTPFTPLDFYDYPFSHGLVAVVGWSFGVALVYYALRRYKKGAWIVALGVISHWILDFITHRPDMPIVPGLRLYLGLGLWNSVLWTIVVEGTMFIVGVILYSRSTTALDRTGRYAFRSIVVFFILAYIADLLSPPPPGNTALAVGALLFWLIVPWGYWVDRHRKPANR
jgi:hypothetical protein